VRQRRYLIIGAFGIGALEHQYLRGLRQLGHDVTTFDMQTPLHAKRARSVWHRLVHRAMPAQFVGFIQTELLSFLQGKQFDVILIFKGMQLLPETVAAIKPHARLLVNYNPDHPFEFYSPGSGNAFVRDSIRYYDLYLSYAGSIVEKLEKQFGVRAACLPFGYDETYRPNWGEASPENFVFVGAWDRERAAFFREYAGDDLQIFGDAPWGKASNGAKIARFFQKTSLYDDAYRQTVTQAAGVFNVLREQNIREQSHNMRTFEVPGAGGLMLAQRTEEQMSFLEDGREAIFFDDVTEMNERVAHLRKHPGLIQAMKKAAFVRAEKSGYGYGQRARQLDALAQSFL
jgi:spore maturation protein CgeB